MCGRLLVVCVIAALRDEQESHSQIGGNDLSRTAELCAEFARHRSLDCFAAISDEEAETHKVHYDFSDGIAARRVQNARKNPIGAGAQMCATAQHAARPRPACVAVFAGAFNKYAREDFNSMMRHEAVHCGHLLANATEVGFWRKVIAARLVHDPRADEETDLYTPMTESEAWLSYLNDPNASYYFLREYRVFTVLDDYLWKAERLIAGLRDRRASGEGFVEEGPRKALADECQKHANKISMEARRLFPELSVLSSTARDSVRLVRLPA